MSYLDSITDPHSVITPIEYGLTFPEKLHFQYNKYQDDIRLFKRLVKTSNSSAALLGQIRDDRLPAKTRMSLLKLFRRCVSTVCDTEMTKKIKSISTSSIVGRYGYTFKPIRALKESFANLSAGEEFALASLIGEYDDRGKLGYLLTELFFNWFESKFPNLRIEGPRGAGRDIELSSLFTDFDGRFPCDFVIYDRKKRVLAVGFARYDSTRGGAQSDDRTSGNEAKTLKVARYSKESGRRFRVIFIADGPGLAHRDTWQEARGLDDSVDGNVRVVTYALCDKRITLKWLMGRTKYVS